MSRNDQKEQGGGVVRVTGLGFQDGLKLHCWFGSVLREGTYLAPVNGTVIGGECPIPAHIPGVVRFSVSHDNYTSHASKGDHWFVYYSMFWFFLS